jgi:hypothetical protein
MITKGKIIDQILRLSAGGSTNDEKEISREDVALLVSQVINRLLKTEHLSVNMPLGADYPPHTLITTYKVARKKLEGTGEISRDYYLRLPVMPISLPRNMGIWSVTDDEGSTEYIPIESGQQHHLRKQEGLFLMELQPYYWVEGQTIFIRYPLFDINPDDQKIGIRVKLLIVDPNVIGEYDYLQIPIEMEEAVVKEVLTLIGALPKVVDKASDTNNQI